MIVPLSCNSILPAFLKKEFHDFQPYTSQLNPAELKIIHFF